MPPSTVEISSITVIKHNPSTSPLHRPINTPDEAREVTETHTHEDMATWLITTADGGTITTTPTHRFWVEGKGWTAAQDLHEGDQIGATVGSAAAVVATSTAATGQTSTVHNLTTEGLHNYYTLTDNGTSLLVHNTYTGQAVPGSKAYTYEFEAVLEQRDLGRNRDLHFRRANAQLEEALRADPVFRAELERTSPGVLDRVSSTGGREKPLNYTWHHEPTSNVDGREGVLRLVPSTQHRPGSEYWKSLHPDGYGGYAEWAILKGARPN